MHNKFEAFLRLVELTDVNFESVAKRLPGKDRHANLTYAAILQHLAGQNLPENRPEDPDVPDLRIALLLEAADINLGDLYQSIAPSALEHIARQLEDNTD